jgi:hypothetical protein
VRKIPLRARDGTVRAYALIDDEDYDTVTARLRGNGEVRWSLDSDGYAVRSTWRDRKRTTFKLHRVIMAAPPGVEVDHEDRNRLNCCRSNLRLATRAQNAQNVAAKVTANSGHRNVYWKPKRRRYQVQFKVGGRAICIGWFEHLEDAIAAAHQARKELHPYAATQSS